MPRTRLPIVPLVSCLVTGVAGCASTSAPSSPQAPTVVAKKDERSAHGLVITGSAALALLDAAAADDAVIARVLGDEMQKHAPQELAAFADLFRKVVHKRFGAALGGRSFEVVVERLDADEHGDLVLHGFAREMGAAVEVEVDLVTRRSAGGLQIVDVVLDGTAAVETLRRDLAGAVAKGGWQGLMAKLQSQLAS